MPGPGGKTAAELLVEAEQALQVLWDAEYSHASPAEQATAYANAHAACVPLVRGNE